jgi:hypothetical protein
MKQADGLVQSCLHEGMFLTTQWNERAGPSQASTLRLAARRRQWAAASSDIAVSNLVLRERDVIYLLGTPRSIYLCQPSYSTNPKYSALPVRGRCNFFLGKLTPQLHVVVVGQGLGTTPGCMGSTILHNCAMAERRT